IERRQTTQQRITDRRARAGLAWVDHGRRFGRDAHGLEDRALLLQLKVGAGRLAEADQNVVLGHWLEADAAHGDRVARIGLDTLNVELAVGAGHSTRAGARVWISCLDTGSVA